MSRKLKVLSGSSVVKILEKYNFSKTRTVGSHVRMTRNKNDTSFHITIPLHLELKKGTLSGILRELEGIIDKSILEEDFYNK